jgi:hypothetical protein
MKIDRVGNIATRGTRSGGRGRTGNADSFFDILGGADRAAAANVSGAAPVNAVDALLALQEVGDDSGADAKARQRGEDLLDRLDEIRLALLEGRLSEAVLHRLSDLAAKKRGQVRDPKLAEILDEIELRAAVELAKLTR